MIIWRQTVRKERWRSTPRPADGHHHDSDPGLESPRCPSIEVEVMAHWPNNEQLTAVCPAKDPTRFNRVLLYEFDESRTGRAVEELVDLIVLSMRTLSKAITFLPSCHLVQPRLDKNKVVRTAAGTSQRG
jgi:hypothetical protein